MNHETDLLSAVRQLVDTHSSCLRRTVRKNLSRLTGAFLQLALSVRFGCGGLHLTSIARVLPEGKKFKSSYKWLSRFLKCKYFRCFLPGRVHAGGNLGEEATSVE